MIDYERKLEQLKSQAIERALDVLLSDLEVAMISEPRARAAMEMLAQEIMAASIDIGRTSLLTTEMAAQQLGLSPRRIRALAKDRGLGWHLGRDIIFTPEDVERMKSRIPGRPRAENK